MQEEHNLGESNLRTNFSLWDIFSYCCMKVYIAGCHILLNSRVQTPLLGKEEPIDIWQSVWTHPGLSHHIQRENQDTWSTMSCMTAFSNTTPQLRTTITQVIVWFLCSIKHYYEMAMSLDQGQQLWVHSKALGWHAVKPLLKYTLLNEDTWLSPSIILFFPWKKDTSLIRTVILVPC